MIEPGNLNGARFGRCRVVLTTHSCVFIRKVSLRFNSSDTFRICVGRDIPLGAPYSCAWRMCLPVEKQP